MNKRFYDANLRWLNGPAGCIPFYPSNGPTFLDFATANLAIRTGYNRTLHPGPPAAVIVSASQTSTTRYVYGATPRVAGVTGVRGFATDASGRLCWTLDGSSVPESVPGELDPNCRILD